MRPTKLAVLAFALLVFATPVLAASRPALFSDEAGFHHARFDNVPITVERNGWIASGMKYWNARAGWDVFVFGDQPEVTHRFDKKCRYCALAFAASGQSWTEPYVGCEISIAADGRDSVRIVAHELGHCLGLRHQREGVMAPGATSEPIDGAVKRIDRSLLVESDYT